MENLLLIIYMINLCYMMVASRFLLHIRILAIQGLLLFGIAFLELKHVDEFNFIFILAETLIFKAIFVPYFLYRIVKRNNLKRDFALSIKGFYAVFVILSIIIISFTLAYNLYDEQLKITFFTCSLSSILTAFFLIIFRNNIIKHIMSYVILENGIFLFSLALGNEMPMIVNTGILLDLFTSVIILGVFANRISTILHTIEVDNLTELKD